MRAIIARNKLQEKDLMTLKYERLLLLESPENKVASNIVIKCLGSIPVVQYDVPAVKNTSLYDDNDDPK